MTRNRYLFFEALRWMGTYLFNFFSRCEERGVLPGASRSIKSWLLGAFIAGMTALGSASTVACCPVTCYVPPPSPIQDVEIKPNPTNGADSVTVEAKASLFKPSKDDYVKSARCFIYGNSVQSDTVAMLPLDGDFDGTYEELRAGLFVGNLDTGIVMVRIELISNKKNKTEEIKYLLITE